MHIWMSTAIVLLSAAFAMPQHISEEHRAQGNRETLLSGIDVYKTHPEEVSRKLGTPYKARNVTNGESSGEKQYWWRSGTTRIRGATMYHFEKGQVIESRIYGVDVWGAPSASEYAQTGSGLMLGDTESKLVKIYGARFRKQRTQRGTIHIDLEWKDGTTLGIDFDNHNRINHMQLISAIE
jgi:hypothetical protein